MKNVKFLTTSAGTYGVAHAGDQLTLKDSVATQLEKQGTVKVTGDAGEDAEESVAPKGSVRITEVRAESVKEEKADKYDPANEAKNKTKEKNDKAGPNAPKKKGK
jgi:hypothetical protein